MGRLSDEQYRALAYEQSRDGEIEVDAGAVVSNGDDAGAYVQAWLWVNDPDCLDENGMVVDLEDCLDETENPFDHQSGPSGCPDTCPACGWEWMKGA